MLDATIFVASAASLSVVLTIVIFIVSITWRREAKAAAKHQLVAKLTEQYIPLHAFVRKMRILLWWRENLAVNSGMHSRFAPFVRGTFRTVREHAKALALDQIPSRDEDATGWPEGLAGRARMLQTKMCAGRENAREDQVAAAKLLLEASERLGGFWDGVMFFYKAGMLPPNFFSLADRIWAVRANTYLQLFRPVDEAYSEFLAEAYGLFCREDIFLRSESVATPPARFVFLKAQIAQSVPPDAAPSALIGGSEGTDIGVHRSDSRNRSANHQQ